MKDFVDDVKRMLITLNTALVLSYSVMFISIIVVRLTHTIAPLIIFGGAFLYALQEAFGCLRRRKHAVVYLNSVQSGIEVSDQDMAKVLEDVMWHKKLLKTYTKEEDDE